MAREIRITVDDDEIFERMKHRKRELDLSWEDVLHRGLGTGDFGPQQQGSASIDPGDELAERLERQIRQRVEGSLERAFGLEAAEPTVDRPRSDSKSSYEADMKTLANAEDARLRFPALEEHPQYTVPLRVTLAMRSGGVDVSVVAIRQGKDVEGMNRFDRQARRTIAEALARGESAILELESGIEEYRVDPILSWSRDEADRPVVSDLDIEQVLFDDRT